MNEELFFDLADASKKVERWRRYYNEKRPHSSIGNKTPVEFEKELTSNLTQLGYKSKSTEISGNVTFPIDAQQISDDLLFYGMCFFLPANLV